MLIAAMLLAGAAPSTSVPHAQLTIRERIVLRMTARRGVPAATPIRWQEKRGPRCIVLGDIAGASVSGASSVDFALRGGTRVRAKLDADCPALDFYAGFYLVPPADGRICAGREVIRDRSGGACQVTKLRSLVALPPRTNR